MNNGKFFILAKVRMGIFNRRNTVSCPSCMTDTCITGDSFSFFGFIHKGLNSADGFFGSGNYARFDAILAMYHDQGLAPFKALAMDDGVNYTAGLPVIRTSPAHVTAYDIAGKGVADENSFRQAVYTAIDIFRNRSRYEEAYAHPLKKQYYEKRDDSDKLKLDQVTEDDQI